MPKPILVLNALPLAIVRGERAVLELQRLTYREALELIAGAEVESYIRHPATAELLRVPVSDALLGAFAPGDVALVATLRLTSRPPREYTPTPDDLVIWLVKYKKEDNPAEKDARAHDEPA